MSDQYLTLVFRQPLDERTQALLNEANWVAASHSHAIRERDAAQKESAKLKAAAQQAFDTFHAWYCAGEGVNHESFLAALMAADDLLHNAIHSSSENPLGPKG